MRKRVKRLFTRKPVEQPQRPRTEKSQRQLVLDALSVAQREAHEYVGLTRLPCHFLYDHPAEEVRGDMLASVQLFPERFTMIKSLIQGGAGAEVGVREGAFSQFMLDNLNPKSLALFEKNCGQISKKVLDDARVTLYCDDSSTMLSQCNDRSLDWIYIDGNHSYEGVKKDTAAARKKVKSGGILMFDDYTPWSPVEIIPYGVVPVVNALINEGHPVIGLSIAPHGYFNIALRYSG